MLSEAINEACDVRCEVAKEGTMAFSKAIVRASWRRKPRNTFATCYSRRVTLI
jgi:hypothetical protein